MSQPLRPLTDLPRGGTLRIADGKAHVIDVFEGQVWLTQDGDLRDVILEAGESFAFERPGLTLVLAFRDARLLVSDVDAQAAPTRSLDSAELHRRARAQRDAALGALIARGLAAAESALASGTGRLIARLHAAPRPLRTSGARA